MIVPRIFEWDEAKAASNEAKHGVPFEAAAALFLNEDRLDETDTRRDYREERRNIIGCVDGVVLTATYTMRGDVVRIISVRFASRKERLRYGDRS